MRKLLFASTVLVAATLVACSSSQTALTLSVVQSEAVAIDSALDSGVAVAEATGLIVGPIETTVNSAVAIMDGATKTVSGLTTSESASAYLSAFSGDVTAVVNLLPITTATKAEIDLGLSIIDAFAAGATISPVPAGTSLAIGNNVVASSNAASLTPESNRFGTPIVPIPIVQFNK
jgi:hypothetical protein